MKLISFDTIKKLNISPNMCYDWVEEMIKNKDRTILPPKVSMKPSDGVFCNVMPCMISGDKDFTWGGKSCYALS